MRLCRNPKQGMEKIWISPKSGEIRYFIIRPFFNFTRFFPNIQHAYFSIVMSQT